MDKVPDAGAFANLCALVDDGAAVDGGHRGMDCRAALAMTGKVDCRAALAMTAPTSLRGAKRRGNPRL
jgi:hypothetical protein